MTATVCILTFNGEQFLDEILRACAAQEAAFGYEVLVLDSGSSDDTLAIVSRHPDVRLHEIPNREFGHGRTRNLAASLAHGEVVVFLTHDATPADPSWLRHLVEPVLDDGTVAGVFARQKPRSGCRPTAAREVLRTFEGAPPAGFFSNVCSAIRKDVLQQIPFRDVDYSEDRAFASDAAARGLRIVYVPAAEVLHSHDLPLRQYFRRMFDEAAGIRRAGGTTPRSALLLAAAAAYGSLQDWVFVATSPDYSLPTRLRWGAQVPLYNVARRLAIWLAARDLPDRMARVLSLDVRRRKAAAG